MSGRQRLISPASWTHWYRRALPAYWIFLFCGTHFPKPRLTGQIPSEDKLVHAVVFGLLAFLFWRFVQTFRRPLSWRFVWIAWFWLAAYAGFDEYTQSFVGRGVDVCDWLCGLAGITVVLAVLEWLRRRSAKMAA